MYLLEAQPSQHAPIWPYWDKTFLGNYKAAINSVATSQKGQYMVAGSEDGNVYVSDNFGKALEVKLMTSDAINAVCISGNGQYMAAGGANNQIYVSQNHGESWPFIENTQGNISSIACAYDGSTVIAGSSGDTDKIYTLINGGVSWHQENVASDVSSVAVSANGQQQVLGQRLMFRTIVVLPGHLR